MFGGDDSNTGTILGDTWTWDGSNWTQQHPSPAPPARVGAAMAWDGHELVLYGGTSREGSFGGEFHDTWLWTGAGWTQQSSPQSPRAGLTEMVFDGRGAMAFGGQDPHGDFVGETWRWSAGSWTQLSPTNAPSARVAQEMDFDEARGVVLLLGGSSGNTVNADTWSWNGVDWSPLAASLQSSGGGMAFDGRTDVLTDRLSWPGAQNTTYTFEGSSWQPQQSATVPPNALGPGLAFDPAHRDVLLFGGVGGSNNNTSLDQTWVWTEGSPPTAAPTSRAVSSARPTTASLPPTGATSTSPSAVDSSSPNPLPVSPPSAGTPPPHTLPPLPATAAVSPIGSAVTTVALALAIALVVAAGSAVAIRRRVRPRRR